MVKQQEATGIYIALALATFAAIMSAEKPAAPRGLTDFLLLTSAPEAAAAAGAIGEDPDAVTPR
ncbi:MAG TPA: hypothetical protein VGG99_24855 [Acetobacteraceae bacterium]|jgi:hypothetical protein